LDEAGLGKSLGDIGQEKAKMRDPSLATLLLEIAESNPTDLDSIEWVIWASGEKLALMLEKNEDGTKEAFAKWAFHPNARVRRWAAGALNEYLPELEPEDEATEFLARLLARLADDPNEHVCNAAAALPESESSEP
jgi:hypothetical protein